ncbi:MAG: hypothetical protein ACXW1D_00480 [Halobacteriota archaeon]
MKITLQAIKDQIITQSPHYTTEDVDCIAEGIARDALFAAEMSRYTCKGESKILAKTVEKLESKGYWGGELKIAAQYGVEQLKARLYPVKL